MSLKNERPQPVSIDLQEWESTADLVRAIKKDSPDATVSHIPGLVRIECDEELIIRRQTVEDISGSAWLTQDFQLNLVSYAGNFSVWDDDQIIVRWEHTERNAEQ